MAWWWSWLLSIWAVTGLWVAGDGRRIGWAIGFTSEFAWLAYSIISRQWGFLMSVIIFGFMYARNWLKWKEKHSETLHSRTDEELVR